MLIQTLTDEQRIHLAQLLEDPRFKLQLRLAEQTLAELYEKHRSLRWWQYGRQRDLEREITGYVGQIHHTMMSAWQIDQAEPKQPE